ncbi:hypothetical protein [Rheinheimera texasensis]|uniref:hypothetical protein n=1 Tax=Rheinheimera texasensis TaxID=306205 RepID=UPI0004E21BE6|nr:hypothetical protein [Rheinheimera texasensis]
MTESIGSQAVGQSYEMLGAALAKTQQKQEAQMTMQLLQSATVAQPAAPIGNLGQNVDIMV